MGSPGAAARPSAAPGCVTAHHVRRPQRSAPRCGRSTRPAGRQGVGHGIGHGIGHGFADGGQVRDARPVAGQAGRPVGGGHTRSRGSALPIARGHRPDRARTGRDRRPEGWANRPGWLDHQSATGETPTRSEGRLAHGQAAGVGLRVAPRAPALEGRNPLRLPVGGAIRRSGHRRGRGCADVLREARLPAHVGRSRLPCRYPAAADGVQPAHRRARGRGPAALDPGPPAGSRHHHCGPGACGQGRVAALRRSGRRRPCPAFHHHACGRRRSHCETGNRAHHSRCGAAEGRRRHRPSSPRTAAQERRGQRRRRRARQPHGRGAGLGRQRRLLRLDPRRHDQRAVAEAPDRFDDQTVRVRHGLRRRPLAGRPHRRRSLRPHLQRQRLPPAELRQEVPRHHHASHRAGQFRERRSGEAPRRPRAGRSCRHAGPGRCRARLSGVALRPVDGPRYGGDRSARSHPCLRRVRPRWSVAQRDVHGTGRPPAQRCPCGLTGDCVPDRRRAQRQRGTGLGVRADERVAVPVPRCRENGHVAGLPRQLGRRLHRGFHRRRLGGQLRPPAAARRDRRHRCRPDLPCGDAGHPPAAHPERRARARCDAARVGTRRPRRRRCL